MPILYIFSHSYLLFRSVEFTISCLPRIACIIFFSFFFLYWQFLDFWSAINYLDLISLPTEYIYVYIFSDERVGVYKLGKELRRTWLACYSMFSWKEDKVETRIHRTSEIYVCVLRNALRRNDYLLHMHIVHEWVIYSSSLHGARNAAFCNGL